MMEPSEVGGEWCPTFITLAGCVTDWNDPEKTHTATHHHRYGWKGDPGYSASRADPIEQHNSTLRRRLTS